MPSASLGSALTHIDAAVQALGEGQADAHGVPPEKRTQARKSLARALGTLIQSEGNEQAAQLRSIIDGLTSLVDTGSDVYQLERFQEELRLLHGALATRTGRLQQVCVVQKGPVDLRADFHRLRRTSETTSVGMLGSTLIGGPAAALAAAVMGGALSVAARGMGRGLEAAPLLTILDRALKESLSQQIPVSMVAWQYDSTQQRLVVASAAHRALWRVRDGSFRSIRNPAAEPLGLGTHTFKQVPVDAQPGDLLIGLTAGVFDQDDANGRTLREQAVRLAILDVAAEPEAVGLRLDRLLTEHCSTWTVPATCLIVRL